MTKAKKRLGLVLGSGGGRGFAHIGVLKALQGNGIMPDRIIGSSVGALVGALFCRFGDHRRVEEALVDLDWKEFPSLLHLRIGKGLLAGVKLRKQLKSLLGTDDFDDLRIPLEAVATDILTAKPVYFDKGSLSEAIQASIALPMFIEPLIKGKDAYWDGGLSDPLPVGRARESSDVVLAVSLDRYPEHPLEPGKVVSYKTMILAVRSLQHHLAGHSAGKADVLLELGPMRGDSLMDMENFLKKGRGRELIERGERMAEGKIDLIKEALKGN